MTTGLPTRVAFLKLGCIGSLPLIDLIVDERATRTDIEVRSLSTGAHMEPEHCEGVVETAIGWGPDLCVVVSPNAALPGPTLVRTRLHDSGVPALNITDGPGLRAFVRKNADGKRVSTVLDKQGYVVLPMDPMIGAKPEFLDATEMTLFNADVLKVFSACGLVRFLQRVIDEAISVVRARQDISLPAEKVSAERVVKAGGFTNPYAAAKAYAAIKICEAIAPITSQACFKVAERHRYLLMVAGAHEMLRTAALLADAAREMEKAHGTVARTPHRKTGEISERRTLFSGGPND